MLFLNKAGTWKFEWVYVNLRDIYVIIFQKIWMRQSQHTTVLLKTYIWQQITI